MSLPRAEPLSIESLLKKQRDEKDAASKPKFLSKEERAQLAIAKRAAELKEQRERDEKARRDREALERDAEDLARQSHSHSRYGGGTRYDDHEQRYAHPEKDRRRDRREDRRAPPPPQPPKNGYQNVPTGPRADRQRSGPTSHTASPAPSASASMPPPPVPTHHTLPEPATPYVPPMTTDDLSAIRSRYLGVDKKKRKIRKMNDRKFVFDWDAQDDTFVEDAPVAVGSARQGAQVMFGRGRLAGMDDGG
ncbi:hypothetical protein BV22DRAFT_1130324, partial [Leucogyrophana mollusca]